MSQIILGYLTPFYCVKISHLYNAKYCVCCCCAQHNAEPVRTERFRVKEVSLIYTLIGVSLVAKEMDHCETQQILRMLHNVMLKSNLLCGNIVWCGILVVGFVCFLSSLQLLSGSCRGPASLGRRGKFQCIYILASCVLPSLSNSY